MEYNMGEFLELHQWIFDDLADEEKINKQVTQLLESHVGYEEEDKKPVIIKKFSL
jgi:hypothetical protein